MNAIDIIRDTAALYGITAADMGSPCRRRDMADARIVACYVLNKHYGVTFSECARLLHRSHADIIHLVRVAGEWLDQPFLNPRGADNIEQLLKRYYNDTGTNGGRHKRTRRGQAAIERVEGVATGQAHAVVSGHKT